MELQGGLRNQVRATEKVEGMVRDTIKRYGEDPVRAIFEREASSYSPHPKNFWAEIKKLKAKEKVRQLMEKFG